MLVGVLIPQVWKQSYLSELGWRKVYDKLLSCPPPFNNILRAYSTHPKTPI